MSGGGVVYNDFLAMADNKKLTKDEEDLWGNKKVSQKNMNISTSLNDRTRLNYIKSKPLDITNRVHSENTFIKDIGGDFMNKTVEVGQA